MAMGISVVRSLFEPLAERTWYVLSDSTIRLLGHQDQTMLTSAIVSWTDSAFNSQQVGRLVQELRAIGKQQSLDERTHIELEGAADLIERESAGKSQLFVVFKGN